MLPGTSGGDLVYATGACNGTCVFSYPQDTLVGTLPVGNGLNSGACSNASGDVFITDTSTVYEYAHGGSSPIATLALPGNQAAGCSVDPTSGNLAVAFAASDGNIAIFKHSSGTPTVYTSHLSSLSCGYDDKGNLFADGYDGQAYGFSELQNGMSQFVKLSVSQSVGRPGQVQWDGKYITYQGVDKNNAQVSRLSISGSTASVVSTTHFKNVFMSRQSWIYGTRVFIPYVRHGNQGHPNKIGVWKYPKGGKATKNLSHFGQYKQDRDLQAVTLSVAPQ
jgi:hypothetical protein